MMLEAASEEHQSLLTPERWHGMTRWTRVPSAATPQAPLSLAWAAIPCSVLELVVGALHAGDGAPLRAEVRPLVLHVARAVTMLFLT